MKAIIFNTESDFNTFSDTIFNYVKSNFKKSKLTKWSVPIAGTDNTFLMLGVHDLRLKDFDFGEYSVVEIETDNEIYFPNAD